MHIETKHKEQREKKKLLFVITQFYKGGAEVALLNLFRSLSEKEYEVDFLIFDQMILKNAQSLIEDIPKWIRVCNASEKEGSFAVVIKILFKIYLKVTKRQLYRPSAYRFVNHKKYDAAFSYGEWMSPEFVAKKVSADKRMVWIHTDIDKAKYIDEKIFFGFDSYYNKYIFVSEHSRLSAESKFPFVKEKSAVVHNMCDEQSIREDADEAIREWEWQSTPVLLSVGNLREEKNYPRQIEVMRILKERGVICTWLCIGSTSNVILYQQVKSMLEKYQLQENFIFLGAEKNPHKYMKMADAVMVLSDYESWSLVITEAKILGIPVIATETSGAREQINNGETGILTSFENEEIADRIQEFLENKEVSKNIRKNLEGFTMKQETMKEFLSVLGE